MRVFFAIAAVTLACLSLESRPARVHAPEIAPVVAPTAIEPVPASAPRLHHARAVTRDRIASSHTASTLSGIVRRADGTPAPSVDVRVVALELADSVADDDTAETTTMTDEAGAFDVDLAPGDYAIWAADVEHGSSLVTPLSLSSGEQVSGLELVLAGPTVLSAIVVDGAGNVVHASLDVRLPGQHATLCSESSSADGKVTLSALPDTQLELYAHDDEGHAAHVTIARPERDLVLRLLETQPAIVAIVVGADGAPVDNATISFTTDREGQFSNTGDDGRAEFTTSARKVKIRASSDDGNAEVEIETALQHGPVVLHLVASSTIRGRVVDENGVAANGVVTVRQVKGDVSHDVLLVEGRYELTGLEAGAWILAYQESLEAAVASPSVTLPFTLKAGDERELPVLRLPALRRVRGRILDELGAPVPDADVDLMWDSGVARIAAHSDETGAFVVTERGSFELRATDSEGRASAIVSSHGGGDEVLDLAVVGSGEISGVVRGAKAARARCTGGLWHDVDASGHYDLDCGAGSSLEIAVGDDVRTVPVEVLEDETTYVDLRW